MILNIEPVTDILPCPVDGNGLTCESFQDDYRNEFFWKLVRSVVVRAIGDQYRQTKGVTPGTGEVVR